MSRNGGSRPLERLWYSDSPLALLLQPLAWIFAAAVGLRRWLYARGWLQVERVAVPVIVVGNITVGGTGKTPVVAWLADRLRAEGFRPAIVSRGYGGIVHRQPVRVTAASTAADVGDEPLVLARRAAVPVVVCVRRVAAASMLAAAGVDVIIADDGLQHYALARDLEIIVLDGSRQLGNGRLLPAGPLREPLHRLEEGALILVNGSATAPGQFGFTLRVTGAVLLNGSDRHDLSFFAGRKVWAVAGIGNPGRFHAELRRHGIEPVPVNVSDHGRVDLAKLRAAADWPILMTEKDAVKYAEYSDPAAWYVPVVVEMPQETAAMVMGRVRAVMRGAPVAAELTGGTVGSH